MYRREGAASNVYTANVLLETISINACKAKIRFMKLLRSRSVAVGFPRLRSVHHLLSVLWVRDLLDFFFCKRGRATQNTTCKSDVMSVSLNTLHFKLKDMIRQTNFFKKIHILPHGYQPIFSSLLIIFFSPSLFKLYHSAV